MQEKSISHIRACTHIHTRMHVFMNISFKCVYLFMYYILASVCQSISVGSSVCMRGLRRFKRCHVTSNMFCCCYFWYFLPLTVTLFLLDFFFYWLFLVVAIWVATIKLSITTPNEIASDTLDSFIEWVRLIVALMSSSLNLM